MQAAGAPPAAGGAATAPAPARYLPPIHSLFAGHVRNLAAAIDARYAKYFDDNSRVGGTLRRPKFATKNTNWRRMFIDDLNLAYYNVNQGTRRKPKKPYAGDWEVTAHLRRHMNRRTFAHFIKVCNDSHDVHPFEDVLAFGEYTPEQIRAVRDFLYEYQAQSDGYFFNASMVHFQQRMDRGDQAALQEMIDLLVRRSGRSPEDVMKSYLAAKRAKGNDHNAVSVEMYKDEGASRKYIAAPPKDDAAPVTATGAASLTADQEAEKAQAVRQLAFTNIKLAAEKDASAVPAAVISAIKVEEEANGLVAEAEKAVAAAGADAKKKADAQSTLNKVKELQASKVKKTDAAIKKWLDDLTSDVKKAEKALEAAKAEATKNPTSEDAKKAVEAAQKALDAANAKLNAAKGMSVESTSSAVAAASPFIVKVILKEAQDSLAKVVREKASVKREESLNKIIDQNEARVDVKTRLRFGGVRVGNTNSPLGRLQLIPSIEKPFGDSVSLGIEGEIDINRGGYKPGNGDSAQDMFGAGQKGKIGDGGFGISSLSPYALLLNGMLKAKLGMNEVWVDMFGPLGSAVGKTVLPGAINVIAGIHVIADSAPKYDEDDSSVRLWGSAAAGIPVDSINLGEGEGISFVKDDKGNNAHQLDLAASVQAGGKLDGKQKSSVVLNGHLVGTSKNDKTYWDAMLNVSGRGFYNNWRFNFDWRPINSMSFITPYQNGISHWAIATEGGYDFGAISLMGAFSHATGKVLRTIAAGGDGSPSVGTPETSEVTTSLTDVSLVAKFKLSSMSSLAIRASKIWVPEGDGYTGLLTWEYK